MFVKKSKMIETEIAVKVLELALPAQWMAREN